MHENSLSHLSDSALAKGLRDSLRQERASTNTVLAHFAEFDARQLYRAAGFPSMYVYCIEELHLSEGAALKRIRAARATNRFAQLFELLADGRMHLSGLAILANHLTSENVEELVALCTHKPKKWIEELVAARFPRQDMPERVRLLAPSPTSVPTRIPPSPGTVENCAVAPVSDCAGAPVSSSVPSLGAASDNAGAETTTVTSPQPPAAPVTGALPHARVTPLSADRWGVQATVAGSTHEKLRRAHELLGLPFGSGHIATVLDHALDALLERLEKRKFASTEQPRSARSTGNPRTIPAAVKRAVRARDRGQCTYETDDGRRCPEKSRLEFEHVIPVARGGEATVDNIRLLCRAHNQLAAEHAFGAGFMENKRQVARAASSP